jgi:hypothetical protein
MVGFSVYGSFVDNSESPYHDEQWVLCTEEDHLRAMDNTIQIAAAWERTDPPRWRVKGGPFLFLLFLDGSGLALRQHPTAPRVYALPTLPFVGYPTGAELDLLWQPCLDPFSGAPVEGLLPHELLLPTRGGMATRRKHALQEIQETASLLRGLYPTMPSPLALYGGTGVVGPYYHHPERENLGDLTRVVDGMTRLARRLLPGRLGLQQGWNKQASLDHDPRVPTLLATHATFGGSFTSTHHKMSVLHLLEQDTPQEGTPV